MCCLLDAATEGEDRGGWEQLVEEEEMWDGICGTREIGMRETWNDWPGVWGAACGQHSTKCGSRLEFGLSAPKLMPSPQAPAYARGLGLHN